MAGYGGTRQQTYGMTVRVGRSFVAISYLEHSMRDLRGCYVECLIQIRLDLRHTDESENYLCTTDCPKIPEALLGEIDCDANNNHDENGNHPCPASRSFLNSESQLNSFRKPLPYSTVSTYPFALTGKF